MSADWSEMQELQGGNFLADTPKPSRNWLQNYIHPDDRAQVLAAIHAAIEAKGLFELEHRVIRADGTIGWTYSRAVPLLNATGEIVEWFGEASDITDRKRREANLAFLAEIQNDCARLTTADEIMQTVGAKIGSYLNLSICAFVDVDEAQERAIVHHTWHREDAPNLIGTYRISEFVTEAFYTAVRAGDIIIVNDTNTDARTHAQNCAVLNIQAFIHVPLLREGQWKFLFNGYDSRPRQWQEDEIDLFRELANHIFPRLERARAEEAVAADLQDTQLLRELGARLVTEGDFQILYQEIIAAAITITQAQAGTLQLLDAATNELVMLASQNIPLEMSEPFCRIDASFNTSCGVALRVGERSFVDFDVPESEDSHGSLRLLMEAGYLSAQSTPLITRSGRLIGMVSNHWRTHYRPSDRQLRFLDLLARQAADLIEQRQTEAERERLLQQAQAARAEAEQTNRIKDEFLAVLSHELRSPLNPILGWSRLLQNGKLDAAKTAQALTTIERNAKLQSELIEDLLDVSRILQGKLSLNVSPVHLAATIRGAIETVRLAADAKSVAVEAKLDSEVGQVSGDATRLQQVVWNLLSNAVKFTPVGGRVEVRLEQVNGQAQITVSDNGKGISATFLPHVFDHFRQEDGATTRKFGGLGLGLAIVRHLVELHGGTVEVASAGEGLGAMFTVKLPLLRTENRELRTENLAPSTQYSALRPLEGLQILVIDDETDSREFVAFVLEQAGASVTTAATASAGFLAFTQSPPDVLISDIGMPDMDGYMLMRQVRRLPLEQGGQVKAIALTAYAGEGDQQQALHTGFQQHLAKPVEPDTLVRAIAKLLRRNL
ncbi:ATP-binding protein [Nostoc sp. T09]|uniref:ATP-binding protein n=1 Tax=Nostoc sp. T09 TaxID=1932621 RepID=UPI00277D1174|nr:ATP-binding protein [Nostoc sp. T09]